jgi:ABC-type polysaccharide/polyol phosphate transport system ATPase subunit
VLPPAIAVDGVRKQFARPHHQVHTLKERVLHPLRRSTYDRFTAVDDVSFDVREGEFFGIVGRNGSGKSTLLKLMAGIYRTDAGQIWVRGRMSTFIELGVGFNPDLAARDNVILNAIMLGLTPAQAQERYEHVLAFAELKDFEDLKLKNYSSGMHVRLAFSVMIQVDADVLLIDEVLAVGDAAFQQKCFDEFNRLRDEGRTIVLVTHDMGAVRRFCHRAMLMERGQVVELGDPEHVGARYLELNFQQEAAPAAPAPEEERHGDGRAVIEDTWAERADGDRPGAFPQGEEIVLKTRVRFAEAMEHPVLALQLENEEHQVVFATSTVWTDEHTGVFEAGATATLSVRMRNVLSPGRYHLTPAVSARGGDLQLADRRPRFRSFVVSGAVHTGGLVALEHDLRVSREELVS